MPAFVKPFFHDYQPLANLLYHELFPIASRKIGRGQRPVLAILASLAGVPRAAARREDMWGAAKITEHKNGREDEGWTGLMGGIVMNILEKSAKSRY